MIKKIREWSWERRFPIMRLVLTYQFIWFALSVQASLIEPINVLNVCINIYGIWIEFRVLDRMKRQALLEIKRKEEELAAYKQLHKSLTDLQSAVTKFHSSFQQPSKN